MPQNQELLTNRSQNSITTINVASFRIHVTCQVYFINKPVLLTKMHNVDSVQVKKFQQQDLKFGIQKHRFMKVPHPLVRFTYKTRPSVKGR